MHDLYELGTRLRAHNTLAALQSPMSNYWINEVTLRELLVPYTRIVYQKGSLHFFSFISRFDLDAYSGGQVQCRGV